MLAYQGFMTVLGWSLLDSIWQMAVMWIAFHLLTAGNTRISSAGKHNLVLLFVFIGTEWFVYTLVDLINEPSTPFVPGFIPVSSSANRWISLLSLVYLMILIVRFAQSSFQYYSRRKNISGKSLSLSLQNFADRYTRFLGIPRRVQVYLSDLAETAETSGFFKPLILLPVSLVTRLSPQQVEAILVHELYHIRRNDYLINICMNCFRSIFFFNPFAHLFYKALTRERELACDDGVLEMGFTPALYAEALFCLEKFRQPHPGFSMAADGNKPWLLMERIQRVLGKPAPKQIRFALPVYFRLVTAVVLLSLQPKKSILEMPVPVSAEAVTVMPARYGFLQEKISVTKKEKPSRPASLQKPVRMESLLNGLTPAEEEPAEEPDPPERTFFADNNTVRNFSNQEAAELSQDPVQAVPGRPYIPSASLSYDARQVIIETDSIRDILIQNGMKEIINLSNLKAIACLKKLEIEIVKNSSELNLIEIKNQKLFSQGQRNIKPLLKKLQKQIESKKKQIGRLLIQLQESEEEIIHI